MPIDNRAIEQLLEQFSQRRHHIPFTPAMARWAASLLRTVASTHPAPPDIFRSVEALNRRLRPIADAGAAWRLHRHCARSPFVFSELLAWAKGRVADEDLEALSHPETTKGAGAFSARFGDLASGVRLLQELGLFPKTLYRNDGRKIDRPIEGCIELRHWPLVPKNHQLESARRSLTETQAGMESCRIVAGDGTLSILARGAACERETLLRILEEAGIAVERSAECVVSGRFQLAGNAGDGMGYVYPPRNADGRTPILVLTRNEPTVSHLALVAGNPESWLKRREAWDLGPSLKEEARNGIRAAMGDDVYAAHLRLRSCNGAEDLLHAALALATDI
jgi:hypothetical protein